MPRRVLAAALLALASCVPRAQMCVSEPECGAQSSCVAGRCVGHGAVAAISTARRLLVDPLDAAYVRRGGEVRDPPFAVLGADDGGVLLLRFSVDLPLEAEVLEAYIVLERAPGVDSDPTLLALHALRVVQPWDGRSVTWGRQPLLVDVGAPVSRVRSSSGPLVRLDVRDIVARWRRRERDDFGVAVMAERPAGRGLPFALRPVGALPAAAREPAPAEGAPSSPGRDDEALALVSGALVSGAGGAPFGGPELELYVK
jgi:hypothetical protein